MLGPAVPGAGLAGGAREAGVFTARDVLGAMIKAYEIQGVLSLENSFNRVWLDHVLLVRIASTAIAAHMLGGPASKSSTLCPTPGSTGDRSVRRTLTR